MIEINTADTTIGWVGTGVMGRSMCGHLMDKGYATVVFNRTRKKAEPLIEAGATWAESPKAVAEQSDVVFTMVGFPDDVYQVYFWDDGILRGVKTGSILVDMTTTRPSLAEEIHGTAHVLHAHFVDAPVSGGDVGAKNATLSIMVGGEKAAVDAVMPLLEIMGKKIVHQGEPGAGQHTKMCNQIVIAGTMIGMCESLIYAYKSGLDPEVMLASIAGGAAACWALDNLAPRILRGEMDTGFYVEHFVKDMGIALDEARRMNLSLPGLALVHQLYTAVKANGGARLGTQALMRGLAQLSNIDLDGYRKRKG